jgi:cobalt-zinc-cadmium efflux system membrane fusion protein
MELNRKTWLFVGAAVIAGLGAIWCFGLRDTAAPPAAVQTAAPASTDAPGHITISDDQIAKLGIRFDSAVAAGELPLASLPAIIALPPNARVAVAATIPGVVTQTYVVEGETVRQGQRLAEIASREVLTMGADLARAQSRLDYAAANAARLGQLSRDGVIAGARADEANASLREAQVDTDESARLLSVANASGSRGSYTLTAPIAGRITTASLQTGSSVDGTSAPYVIDAASRYEIIAQLPERLVGSVTPGMQVRLPGGVGGTVTSVGTTIDPATRSASLKAKVSAAPGVVAGKALTIILLAKAPDGAVQVPASALTTLDGAEVVFVRGPGGVTTRKVGVGGKADGSAVILSGVRAGESVVTTGTSELKSLALEK